MRKLAIAVSLFAVPLIGAGAFAEDAAAPAAASATPAAPPPGPGLDLINERCGFCHTIGQVFQKRRTPADWSATVQGMADRGAEVSPEEIKTITDYLAKNYAAADGAPAGGAPGAGR